MTQAQEPVELFANQYQRSTRATTKPILTENCCIETLQLIISLGPKHPLGLLVLDSIHGYLLTVCRWVVIGWTAQRHFTIEQSILLLKSYY